MARVLLGCLGLAIGGSCVGVGGAAAVWPLGHSEEAAHAIPRVHLVLDHVNNRVNTAIAEGSHHSEVVEGIVKA